MLTRICLLLGLMLVIACTPVKTNFSRLGVTSYPEKPKGCDVQILTQAPSGRKYDEIAILTTVANTPMRMPLASTFDPKTGKDLNDMLPTLKETACKLGADAIVIKNVVPGSREVETTGKAYAVAIKFLD
jgi:hypothetical protein